MRRHTLRGHRRADHGRHLSLPRLPVFQRRRAGHALLFPAGSVTLLRGAAGAPLPRRFGPRRHAQLLPDCGTPLFGGTEGANYDVVRAGSLDDPEAFRARVSLWTGSAPSWHHIDAAAPSFPGNAPPIAWGRRAMRRQTTARASPAGLALLHTTSGLPWRAVHLYNYCTTCASLPEAYWAAISVSGRGLDLAGVAGGTGFRCSGRHRSP